MAGAVGKMRKGMYKGKPKKIPAKTTKKI